MAESEHGLFEQFMQVNGLLIHFFHRQRAEDGPLTTPYSGQGRVLKLLKLKPEITQRELTEILGIRSQSLGELLSKLEQNGYVLRTQSETDRRNVIVHLTEKGSEAADTESRSSIGESFFACLSDEEQAQLSDYLKRIIASSELQQPTDGERRHGHHHARERQERHRHF